MKYIDADRLRARIEKYLTFDNNIDTAFYIGRRDAERNILALIDSLQQEQEEPDKSLEEAAMRYAIPAYMKDVDDNYLHEYPRDPIAEKAFIAGAEWYKEQFEKNRLAHCDAASQEDCDRETDFAMEIIEKEHRQPTFDDAIKYGMRLQKEQMLKDAVEGYVNYYEDSGGILMAEAQVGCPYHNSDKVKLIIVKED